MSAPAYIQSMPPDMLLSDGYTIRLSAIDPTTGADVTGVTVTDYSIFGANLAAIPNEDYAYGPFMLVPGPGA